jgi:hypothetical protein
VTEPPGHAGSSLADFYTLKMEAIRSSETSVYTISTRCHISEDGILQRYIEYIIVDDEHNKYNTATQITKQNIWEWVTYGENED